MNAQVHGEPVGRNTRQHVGKPAPAENQAGDEVDLAPDDGADTTEEGVLSPGSTADGSPTSLGQ